MGLLAVARVPLAFHIWFAISFLIMFFEVLWLWACVSLTLTESMTDSVRSVWLVLMSNYTAQKTVARAHIKVEERYYNLVTLSNRAMLGDVVGPNRRWKSWRLKVTFPCANSAERQSNSTTKLRMHILQQHNSMLFFYFTRNTHQIARNGLETRAKRRAILTKCCNITDCKFYCLRYPLGVALVFGTP